MKLDREKLLELAARCERMPRGNSEANDDIAEAIFTGKHRVCIKGLTDEAGGMWMFTYSDGSIGSALRFTTSLDAAMTLVPDLGEIDGKRFDLHNFEKHCIARVYSDEDTDHKARAATPALALTAAALRALAGEAQ